MSDRPPLEATADLNTPSRRSWTPPRAMHGVHLLDYARVLYKRRWTAGTVLLLAVGTVTVYTFTATPIYEARTRLLIEADDPNIVAFKEVIDEAQAKTDYYQTQYNILQSRALARKTLDDLQLWKSPLFGGDLPESRVIDAFLLNLRISPIRNSRLVDVAFRLPDAAVATAIANAMAKNYIEQNLEYKFTASKEASDWLGERLTEQRQQVEASEAALQRYREQNDAISLEGRENIVVQKLADLNAAVTRVKTERLQKEAIYRQLSGGDAEALETFPAILGNAFIQQQKGELAALQRQQAQLAEKLGDRHPEMLKIQTAVQNAQLELQAEIQKVVQAVRTEYLAARAQEESLAAALASQKAEALGMNRKAIEYSVLLRDVESSKQMYQSLLQRAKETSVAGELKSSNIRVVDRAERPQRAVSPRGLLNFCLAFVGGIILACGVAFFFEYLDSRIKSPEEIEAYLGLPAIGMIPALGRNWRHGDPLVNNGVPPGFVEAFRTLRTNVLFSAVETGCRVAVVTSTGPGEGKTMVASNLGIGFAHAGQQVLIIDADMRRPRLHEVLSFDQEPGLSNVLVGDAKLSAAVRQTSVPGMSVLTAGRLPPNPAELLGARRFNHLLRSVREQFDWIIVDSPPVMAVTDANIVASLADTVVFVIGAEMTSHKIARRAIEQLARGRAVFAGAVLNRVEVERHSYYYSQYYRREYASYYVPAGRS